jgi:hypothetical protein
MRGDTEKNQKTFPFNLYRQIQELLCVVLALSRVVMFYATTEQKLIHSF